MAKLTLKGKIVCVHPVQTIQSKDTTKKPMDKQEIDLLVPGYVDEFGDKKGRDQVWRVACLGDRIKDLKVSADWEQKKAKLDVYVESNYIPATETKPEAYIVNVTLGKVEFFNS